MGFNNEDSLRMVIDIETVRLDDAEQYLDPLETIPEPDLSLITPAKNLVDPVKISADIEKRQQAALDAHLEQRHQQQMKRLESLERCALDVDLCRIVAIGWMREDWHEPKVATVITPDFEPSTLNWFWSEMQQRVSVGYNTLGFDLPVLLRRSLYLGIQHPHISLDKYRTNHIDLQMRLSFNGQIKYRPLSFYCKRFGIACEDTSTGAEIGGLVAAGEWEKVAAHCRADVLKTAALAARMGLLKQQVEAVEAF